MELNVYHKGIPPGGLRSEYRVYSIVRSSYHNLDLFKVLLGHPNNLDLSKVLLGHPAIIRILINSSNF